MKKIEGLWAKHEKIARDLDAVIKKGKVAALDRVADLMTKFDGRIQQLRAALAEQEKSRAMEKAQSGAAPADAATPAASKAAAKSPAKKAAKKAAKKVATPATKSAAKTVAS